MTAQRPTHVQGDFLQFYRCFQDVPIALRPLLQAAFCAFQLRLSYNRSYTLVEGTKLPIKRLCITRIRICTFLDIHYLRSRVAHFYDFAPFCDFCVFLRFRSDRTSEACPRHYEHRISHIINSYQYCHVFLLRNAIVSVNSAEVQRTSTQAHQIWKSSDPTSYSIRPRASVILLENSETRSNLFYLLIKLIVFADRTYDHGVCAFILPPFIHIFVV